MTCAVTLQFHQGCFLEAAMDYLYVGLIIKIRYINGEQCCTTACIIIFLWVVLFCFLLNI